MNDDGDVFARVLGWALVVVFAIGALVYKCDAASSTDAPVRALETEGYRDIDVSPGQVNVMFDACGNDSLHYDAHAVNSQGKRVALVVCCGALTKACTVRVP